ncbi:MAG: serine hydrolase domain-containing protein [Caulobacter sp.]|nr:serine hydrolase domain-containing protein [Caulobacter sp.]
MVRFFKSLAAALFAALVVVALIVAGSLEGWWRKPLAAPGDTAGFAAAATKKLRADSKGNAAFILIKGGRPVTELYLSKGAPVNRDTQFQVASLSKLATAWGVMTLVEQGKLDLDAPVSKYLTRWKLPPTDFDNDKVTVRRLLSHTAGLTDGLGYAGFKPGQPVQSLEASLTRAADASPGRDGRVRVGQAPGVFDYSGGGYTLLQLIIEEVSGQPFNTYMTQAVFAPLGMTRSTYVLEDAPTNLAEFYDVDGSITTHYRFTALAAASLYTSAADMTRLVAAYRPGPNGEPAGRGVLKPGTLAAMRKPEAKQYGADVWGLGTILYAPNNRGDFIIGHDGNNEPAINTAVRMDPATGDGIVILETGNRLLATELGGEWVFWTTHHVDLLTAVMEAGAIIRLVAIGGGVAFLAVFLLVWRLTRRRRPARA